MKGYYSAESRGRSKSNSLGANEVYEPIQFLLPQIRTAIILLVLQSHFKLHVNYLRVNESNKPF